MPRIDTEAARQAAKELLSQPAAAIAGAGAVVDAFSFMDPPDAPDVPVFRMSKQDWKAFAENKQPILDLSANRKASRPTADITLGDYLSQIISEKCFLPISDMQGLREFQALERRLQKKCWQVANDNGGSVKKRRIFGSDPFKELISFISALDNFAQAKSRLPDIGALEEGMKFLQFQKNYLEGCITTPPAGKSSQDPYWSRAGKIMLAIRLLKIESQTKPRTNKTESAPAQSNADSQAENPLLQVPDYIPESIRVEVEEIPMQDMLNERYNQLRGQIASLVKEHEPMPAEKRNAIKSLSPQNIAKLAAEIRIIDKLIEGLRAIGDHIDVSLEPVRQGGRGRF